MIIILSRCATVMCQSLTMTTEISNIGTYSDSVCRLEATNTAVVGRFQTVSCHVIHAIRVVYVYTLPSDRLKDMDQSVNHQVITALSNERYVNEVTNGIDPRILHHYKYVSRNL